MDDVRKCSSCNIREAKEGCKMCTKCLDTSKIYGQRRRSKSISKGLCPYCSKRPPLPGRKMCAACKDYRAPFLKQSYEKCRAEGRCLQCLVKPVTQSGSWTCSFCALKKCAGKNLKDVKRASEIGELLKAQNYRCSYSGVELILGINASLDHKTPKSKGGTDEIQNLHWIESGLNRLKREKTHEEFIPYLKQIALGAIATLNASSPPL